MTKFLFFSNNFNKILEVKKIFKNKNIKILNLNSYKKIREPNENGYTFAENAKIKSFFGYNNFKIPCIADDSGLCIEALNNKPGVKSKRFLEKFSNNKMAFKYIISKVSKKKNYNAFFVTAISLTLNKDHHLTFIGRVDGKISAKPLGNNGFGYDPIFIPNNFNKTFAEMKINEKNSISHRKIAIEKLKSFLF